MRTAFYLIVLLSAILARTAPAAAPVTFDWMQICVQTRTGTIPLTVEVAGDTAQRAQGLMDRDKLPPNEGMLFLFPQVQPPTAAFWMYRTRIPLDIAYLGPDGDIRALRTMTPCLSSEAARCPTYASGVEYVAALEMNRGFFKGKRIAVGDRVLPANDAGCRSPKQAR